MLGNKYAISSIMVVSKFSDRHLKMHVLESDCDPFKTSSGECVEQIFEKRGEIHPRIVPKVLLFPGRNEPLAEDIPPLTIRLSRNRSV